MIKLASLRAAILEANPALANAADSLNTFADKGSITATHGDPLGWLYSYRATLLITDYAGHPDSIVAPLIKWVQRYQPELLHNQTDIEFQVEILSENTCDIAIELPLTEPVRVTTNAEGQQIAEHLGMPDDDDISWTIWLRDQQILPGELPEGLTVSSNGCA